MKQPGTGGAIGWRGRTQTIIIIMAVRIKSERFTVFVSCGGTTGLPCEY
jgi:hypothetical protein